eukprot:jgi/Tetstr1/447719/TSEL_000021.t1
MLLSSAEDAEVKVGRPLTHARLCAFNNTEREAVQGMNVCTRLEDAENSTDEGYEARFACHYWGKEQLVAAEFRFAAGIKFQHLCLYLTEAEDAAALISNALSPAEKGDANPTRTPAVER